MNPLVKYIIDQTTEMLAEPAEGMSHRDYAKLISYQVLSLAELGDIEAAQYMFDSIFPGLRQEVADRIAYEKEHGELRDV